MKCSLNVEEDNSQKLWELISSLEVQLKESTSKVNDMSRQISTLQAFMIDKTDEMIILNEAIEIKDIVIACKLKQS